ncbi:CIA30 family protein [Flavobacterium glaciei]|uniref:Complex I intermediate-associated protein 30 (CIA30) n=1 Tax=Flavobacterium glaciei TaxID=386300 RepID=A0A562PUM9_9FLAO|nr:CIA30 family protein [Flavobacterium glaciei]RDI56214.1 complex I intermediate-associated protein 30 (CIA30) [Flavobacterium glaciei]TWI48124.1 complex I intermediate-associated protein 30 (CIA30) [Flavobacterium glaciei]
MNAIKIFDFNLKSDFSNWKIVNDVVMGGKSESKFYQNINGEGTFEGTVSLENNGGFCAVKYTFEPLILKNATHFCIRIKGDGIQYQFRVKTHQTDSHSYVFPFQTNTDWQTIEIPISELYPAFRGQKLNLPNYDGSNLEEITFLIGNKKKETFQLLIDRIEAK